MRSSGSGNFTRYGRNDGGLRLATAVIPDESRVDCRVVGVVGVTVARTYEAFGLEGPILSWDLLALLGITHLYDVCTGRGTSYWRCSRRGCVECVKFISAKTGGLQKKKRTLQKSYASCPLLRFLRARHAAYEERARLFGQGGAGLLHLGALLLVANL